MAQLENKVSSVKSKSQELRDAVKKRLIPFIHSCGFEDDKRELFKPDPYGHQTRRFMQWNGDRLELVEIFFDKHGGAKFIFEFGVVPPEGVETYFEHVSQLNAGVVHLPQYARLYAGNPYLMPWFGLSTSKIPFIRKRTADDVVDLAIRLFPQAKVWLREGIVGPNIRVKMVASSTIKKARKVNPNTATEQ